MDAEGKTKVQRQKRRRRGIPMWARVLGLIMGALVLMQVVGLRNTAGVVELGFFALLGIIAIVCALLPSRR
jgi:hypothetical protein